MFTKCELQDISKLECSFSFNTEGSILIAKFSGVYGYGSNGNNDGSFMRSMLASYYFAFQPEPITIILDLTRLNYQWGNTIFDSLNFFDLIGRNIEEKQKIMVILCLKEDVESFQSILTTFNIGNVIITTTLDDAIAKAEQNVKDYLD